MLRVFLPLPFLTIISPRPGLLASCFPRLQPLRSTVNQLALHTLLPLLWKLPALSHISKLPASLTGCRNLAYIRLLQWGDAHLYALADVCSSSVTEHFILDWACLLFRHCLSSRETKQDGGQVLSCTISLWLMILTQ